MITGTQRRNGDATERTALVLATVLLASLPLLGGTASAQAGNRTLKNTSRIAYHDGPVMTGSMNVYFIWYGCWTCPGSNYSDTEYLLVGFVGSLGGSAYARILTTYPEPPSGTAPSGGIAYSGAAYDAAYSHGAALTMTDVEDVIGDMILGSQLPFDQRGLYIVLASPDVALPGLEVRTCHYHGQAEVAGARVTYGALNNPRRLIPGMCGPMASDAQSPNDNWVADTFVSMLAHEINGIVTNPTGLGWYDRYGLEAPDKCAGTYGPTYTTANGARANLNFGGHDYLIPQNWVNVGRGYCGLQQ